MTIHGSIANYFEAWSKCLYHVFGFNPSVLQEMMEDLRRRPSSMRPNLAKTSLIAAAKRLSPWALEKRYQSENWHKTKNGSIWLFKFMLSDTLDITADGAFLQMEQDLKHHLHSLDILELISEVVGRLVFEFIRIVHDAHVLLQQQHLTSCSRIKIGSGSLHCRIFRYVRQCLQLE